MVTPSDGSRETVSRGVGVSRHRNVDWVQDPRLRLRYDRGNWESPLGALYYRYYYDRSSQLRSMQGRLKIIHRHDVLCIQIVQGKEPAPASNCPSPGVGLNLES